MRRTILSLLLLLVPLLMMAQPQGTIKGPTSKKQATTTTKTNKTNKSASTGADSYVYVNGEKTTKATFSASESTMTFTVRTNAKSWSLTDRPSWCQVARKTANELDIKVTSNTDASERSGRIRIATPRGHAATIEVTQLGSSSAPAANTANGTVTINRTWVEENVEHNGERGIMFHAHVEADNLKGQELDFQLWLYQSDGTTQVHDTDGDWLWRKETHAPSYDNTEWKDFRFFVPYSQFGSDTPRGQLCYDFDVRDKDFKALASMASQPFNYTPSGTGGGTTTNTSGVSVSKVWYEEGVLKDGERGIMFHAKCNANGHKDEELSFYLWLYQSDESTQVQNTEGEWLWMKEKHTATYENSVWEDFKFFVPYSKFASSTPRGALCFDFEVRDNDFKLLDGKLKEPFNYNPNARGTMSATGAEQGIIHRVWLEHNVYNNGEKGMKVHAHCEVKNMKGQELNFMVWFYQKDDITKVTNPSGGHLYRSLSDTPNYDDTTWKDIWFFIPYSDINVGRPFDDDLAVDFVIRRVSNSKDLIRKDKTLFNFSRK